jgi:inner membrane protein
MLLFGHIGITLGVGLVIEQIIKRHQNQNLRKLQLLPSTESSNNSPDQTAIVKTNLLNIILCAFGSLLPDVIDKPVGNYFFRQTFGNDGRVFSHTLLFFLLMLGIGLYLYFARKKTWFLILAFGVAMHLLLDFMWFTPQTLFWPLLGWEFPHYPEYDWWASLFQGLLQNPLDFIPEILGFFIFSLTLLILIRRKIIHISLKSHG